LIFGPSSFILDHCILGYTNNIYFSNHKNQNILITRLRQQLPKMPQVGFQKPCDCLVVPEKWKWRGQKESKKLITRRKKEINCKTAVR
jgi:hypothetical protein